MLFRDQTSPRQSENQGAEIQQEGQSRGSVPRLIAKLKEQLHNRALPTSSFRMLFFYKKKKNGSLLFSCPATESALLTLKRATFIRRNENWKLNILPQCSAAESMLLNNI